ncbi:MAG: 50S ribosomal protein L18 [Acidimicrobiales bacterium]
MAARASGRRAARSRRQRRVRKKVVGTPQRPRLAVFRSNKHISVQLIDDSKSHTLAAASTYESAVSTDGGGSGSTDAARSVGQLIGERATAAGVDTVVFDRGGNRYHGRVAALADAAREAGLKF